MKKTLFATACAVALLAFPAGAAAGTNLESTETPTTTTATAVPADVTPAAAGPSWIERRWDDFLNTWHEPANMVNNVAQGKFEEAGASPIRFFLNTTLGLGGFFDVASKSTTSCQVCVQRHYNDAATTLRKDFGAPDTTATKIAGAVLDSAPYGLLAPTIGGWSVGLGALNATGEANHELTHD